MYANIRTDELYIHKYKQKCKYSTHDYVDGFYKVGIENQTVTNSYVLSDSMNINSPNRQNQSMIEVRTVVTLGCEGPGGQLQGGGGHWDGNVLYL